MSEKTITLYLCGIDYQHELGECDVKVFESVERLKKTNQCWSKCGIVKIEVDIKKVQWIEKQKI